MQESNRLIRISVLGVMVVALFVALFARLWFLQIISEEEFQEQATANRRREIPIQAPRGEVFDRQGRLLVGNRTSIVVGIESLELNEQLPDPADRIDMYLRLATEISSAGRLTKVADIQAAVNDPRFGPFDRIPIATDVPEEFRIFLAERASEFPGVRVSQTNVRDYPYERLASHVLGYVGPINAEELVQRSNAAKPYEPSDEIGKTGVERVFEDILRGIPGRRVIEVDAEGNLIRELPDLYRAPEPGNDIVLTIDAELQALAERELAQVLELRQESLVPQAEFVEELGVTTFPAPAGSTVVLDPRNGEILAMASYPDFDPAEFVRGIDVDRFEELLEPGNHFPLNNRAIQGAYHPGSTWKPFSAYAAFNTGLLSDRGWLGVGEYLDDQGRYTLSNCSGNCTFQNAGASIKGPVSLREALTVSSDVYFYQMAEQFSVSPNFPQNGIQENALLFGFGEVSGVQLPFEQAGLLEDSAARLARHEANPVAFPNSEWRTGDVLNVSIGQAGILASPLQIANGYAVLANGGTLYAPNLIRQELSPVDGSVVVDFGPRVIQEIYYPDEFSVPVLEGLLGVTQESGSGPIDEETGDPRGAGTAFEAFDGFPRFSCPVAGKTGTSEVFGKVDYSLFAGWMPAVEPEYVVATVLEEAGFGSDAAAPLVRNILEPICNEAVPEVYSRAELDEIYGALEGLELDAAGELALDEDGQPVIETEEGAVAPIDGGAVAPIDGGAVAPIDGGAVAPIDGGN